MKTLKLAFAGAISVACMMQVAHAQTVVTTFADSSNTDLQVWYQNDVRTGGVATIEDLTGLGGDLESNQPLPVGAAKLTTDFTNAAKAEVGVLDAYGIPNDIFASLAISYDYHKAANAGQNASAAPSLKLAFLLTPCPGDEDCYGELVFEPYWNLPGNPTEDTWSTVNIDQSTGLFWSTGMFGSSNSAGGPPMYTLAEWADPNNGYMNANFGSAQLIRVSIGVGSYGQGQIGYFDDVSINHSTYSAVYDFDVEGAGGGTSARFNVVKNFSDGRTDASEVTLTCNGGLPLEQSFSLPAGDVQGVTFTVTDFVEGETRCEVTDDGDIAGYVSSFNNGTVTTADSCVFEGIASGDYSCGISAELQPVAFIVDLDWQVEDGAIDGPSTVQFEFFCENFRLGPNGDLESMSGFFGLSSEEPQTLGIFYPNYTTPESRCRFDTTATSSAVVLDHGCADWVTMSPGQQDIGCTEVATIFFEGIPTLSQYGRAFLVLLMLGLGMVGIRRIV